VPADFERASAASRGYEGFDVPTSSTLWRTLPAGTDLPRYEGDWVFRSGCGHRNVEVTDEAQIKLMKRAKQIFDSTNKLNPGEWGFM
jgi:hypothetical protein